MEKSKPESTASWRELMTELGKAAGIEIPNQKVYFIPANESRDANGRKMTPATIEIPKRAVIADPRVKGEQIQIQYIAKETPVSVGKEMAFQYQLGSIIMENGAVIVDPSKEKAKYIYMMLLDENQSKIGRDTDVRPIYKLSNDIHETKNFLDEKELSITALMEIKSMDDTEIYAICKDLNISTVNKLVLDLRKELYAVADRSPRKIIDNLPNPAAKLAVMVNDAMAKRIIEYNEKQWKFHDGELITELKREPKPTELVDKLVDFLLSNEGQNARVKFESKI